MIPNQPTTTNHTNWLRQIPSSIALLDKNFQFIDASENWCNKFNLRDGEIQGRTLFEVFPKLSDDWKTKLEYALDGLKDIQIIDKLISSNGDVPLNLIWYLNPWKDGYGTINGVILNVKDVTETKELQLELSRTKNLLKEKGQIAKIGSWEYNVESEEVFLSRNVKDIFKIDNGVKLSMDDAIGFYQKGQSRKCIRKAVKNAIENGLPWNENLQLTSRDNEMVWVNTIGRPKFKNGKCTRIIGTIQDITDKASTGTLQFEFSDGNEYQNFFKLAPGAMAVTDFMTGRILEVNDALIDLTGYEKTELVGKSYKAFEVLKGLGRKSATIQQLRNLGRYDTFDIDFRHKTGKTINVCLKGKLITGSKGQKLIVSNLENVSGNRNRTANLRKQVRDANETIEKLVNFNHMVSHNLKGHATNFSLLLNFLEKETIEKEGKKIVSVLKTGTENLTETIKGLREIVAIRNNTKTKKKSVVLNDYIYRTEQGLTGLIKQEKVKIINEISDTTKVKVLPVYLESILTNCISNAIRFRKATKRPVIVISASSNKNYTVLSIEDNGIGMDLDRHGDKLFGLYETLSNNNETRGMGLYLTKYQVELMKGKIEVESALGEGTTFKIYFPNK